MINPTKFDIGRRVLYRARGAAPTRLAELGTVTSFNKQWVFVRFSDGGQEHGLPREDLNWVAGVVGGRVSPPDAR